MRKAIVGIIITLITLGIFLLFYVVTKPSGENWTMKEWADGVKMSFQEVTKSPPEIEEA